MAYDSSIFISMSTLHLQANIDYIDLLICIGNDFVNFYRRKKSSHQTLNMSKESVVSSVNMEFNGEYDNITRR